MKTKVTKKQIMSNYSNVIEVSYCALQTLLNRFSPSYYTCGIYGWNTDIYEIDGLCICTGYRPFGTFRPDYKEIEMVNKQYHELKYQHLSYEEETKAVKELLKSLLK